MEPQKFKWYWEWYLKLQDIPYQEQESVQTREKGCTLLLYCTVVMVSLSEDIAVHGGGGGWLLCGMIVLAPNVVTDLELQIPCSDNSCL